MKALAIMLIFSLSLLNAAFAQESECDYKVEILINGTKFLQKDFTWRMKATKLLGISTNITGTAEIMDSNGKIIKRYNPWKNEPISRQKTSSTYSPNLNEGDYNIVSRINVWCDDFNKVNNIDAKTIKIRPEINQEIEGQKNNYSSPLVIGNEINLTETKNEGQNIIINNTKNETSNSQIIETDKPPANEKIDNEIRLAAKIQKYNEQHITANAADEPRIAYESSNEKSKGLIIIFLLGLSIILNIVLIWKR